MLRAYITVLLLLLGVVLVWITGCGEDETDGETFRFTIAPGPVFDFEKSGSEFVWQNIQYNAYGVPVSFTLIIDGTTYKCKTTDMDMEEDTGRFLGGHGICGTQLTVSEFTPAAELINSQPLDGAVVDPTSLNKEGIRLEFSEPLDGKAMIWRITVDDRELNWNMLLESSNMIVVLRPEPGNELGFGQEVVVRLENIRALAGNESNPDVAIYFTTEEDEG